MSERLQVLNIQIPILEAKLKAMKRERKALKAAVQMRRKRQDPDFNARLAAHRSNNGHFLEVYNALRGLPWPKGSKPHNRYRSLMRKGWTRELAIEKVGAGA